jgi:HlyD family secretion protein
MALPRLPLVIAVTVLSLGVGLTAWSVKKRAAGKADSVKAAEAAAKVPRTISDTGPDYFGGQGPQPVRGAVVVRDTLIISVKAQAQAAAWRSIPLAPEVSGTIASLRVREDDRVPAGSILLALDTSEFVFELKDAETAVQQAMGNYRAELVGDHREKDPVIRASRDSAARLKYGIAGAQNRLERAKMNYERVKLRAPFDGRIADVKVVAGQRVGPGTPALTLLDLDPIKVEVLVGEGQVGLLSPGRGARVTFNAIQDREFIGRIETINPIIDPATRTARVTVSVPNSRGLILPGMYARVSLDAVRHADRVLVPRGAVMIRDRPMVLVFKQEGDEPGVGVAEWRYITQGKGNDDLVELVDNPDTKMVAPGEIVLVAGHYTIAHDAAVRLVNLSDLSDAAKAASANNKPPGTIK